MPAFLGCLYAGAIAVPIMAPKTEKFAETVSVAQKIAQEKLTSGKKENQEAYLDAKSQLKTLVPELGQTIKQRLLEI